MVRIMPLAVQIAAGDTDAVKAKKKKTNPLQRTSRVVGKKMFKVRSFLELFQIPTFTHCSVCFCGVRTTRIMLHTAALT